MNIVYFPPKSSGGKYMGGGFIKVEGFDIRFSVWKSDKNNYGFTVALPYKKQDDGSFINEVETASKEVMDNLYAEVAKKMNAAGGSSQNSSQGYVPKGPAQSAAPAAAAKQPTSINIGAGAIPGKPPF